MFRSHFADDVQGLALQTGFGLTKTTLKLLTSLGPAGCHVLQSDCEPLHEIFRKSCIDPTTHEKGCFSNGMLVVD